MDEKKSLKISWDVLCKGWFHHPNTHWLMVHLWQDDAGRKGGDRPAGGNRSGSAQDDLGAPFSLSALSKSALTHHRQAGGSTACGRRALSRGGSAGVSSPAGIYQQTPTAACALGGAAPMHWGLGGHRPPTSCAGYIPVHCLPLLPVPINEG